MTERSSDMQFSGAFKISLMYLALGGLWILFSDKAVEALASDRDTLTILSILKGWVFIIVTAILLYWMIQRYTTVLRESDERWQSLVSITPDFIALHDREGRFLFLNHYAKGFSKKDVLGKHAHEFVSPEYREIFTRKMQESLSNWSMQRFEHNAMGEYGTSKTYEQYFIPMMEKNKEVIVLSVARDITERKQTEQALNESEERFRKVFRSVPVALAVTRASDGVYIDANDAFSKITGFSLKELTDQTSLELNITTPEQRRVYTQKISEQGFIYNQEMLLKNKSGESRTVLGSMEIIEINHETCVLSTAIDVTERKQMEDAIHTSEYNYRSVLEQASDGIFIANPDGRYIEVNPNGCEMLGYTREEILTKKMSDLIPPEDLTAIPVRTEELKLGKTFLSERRMIRKDGTRLPVEISARMLSDGKFQGIVRDITERKHTEQVLQQSEKKYRALFQNAQIGMYRSKLDGTAILAVNRKLCEIFGYSEEEMLGDPATIRWAHPEARERMIPELQRAGSLHDYEVDILTKSGEVRTCSVSAQLNVENDYLEGSLVDITERKRDEEALRHSEESLRLAALAGHMGTWDRNFVSGQLNWSRECRAMFGVTSEVEVNDERFMEAIYPEDRAPVGLLISDALEKQIDFNTEYRVIWPDGTLHWIAAQGHGYYNENGQAIRMTGVTFDITQRKQVEEAIRESEERLRLSLRAANQGLYDLNVQTGDTIVNREYAQMLGYDADTFVETNAAWIERLHPDDLDVTAKAYADYTNGLTPEYRVEFRQRMKDGNWKWILSLGKIVKYDETGKPLRMLGTHTDITERKRVEEATRQLNETLEQRIAERTAELRASEKQYHSLFDSIDEGFCIIEMIFDERGKPLDYRFLSVNPAFEKQTGLIGAQGKTMRWFAPKHEEYWFEIYGRIALSGESARFENRAEQLHRWYDVYAFRFGEPEKRQVAILFNDINERKEAEENIRHVNAQLESANRELESFSYSVSHDLRSPLRGIDGWSLALLEDYGPILDELGRSHIQKVRTEAQRMGVLIDDILQLSRITRAEMNKESVDISAIAETVVGRLKERQSEDRQVEFVIQKDLTAMGDPKLLDVVLTNLLGNAFKFTSKKQQAHIEFGQTVVEGDFAFFVRDNGAGFDMNYANKLFGAFQRMHRASEFPGTGIGLATVQRIINRHGGSVWASSEVGEGATFYFTLEDQIK